MAPKVSEEYIEERRNQILDAAVATFSRKGFHQTTIEEIRLEAGLSRGAVYHYFKAKEDIIDAIRRRSAQQAEAIYAGAAEAGDAESRLLSLIAAIVSNMASPRSVEANRLGLLLWAESLVNKPIMDSQLASFNSYLDVLAEAIGQAQEPVKLTPSLDPRATARAIIGAMIGIQVQLTWEPDIDVGALRDALISMVTGGLRQDAPLS